MKKLSSIPLAIGVVIVAGIILIFLAGPILAIEVTLGSAGLMYGIERFTPRRADRRVTVPTLVALAITGLLAVVLFHDTRAAPSFGLVGNVVQFVVLAGVVVAGLVALLLHQARPVRTSLLLGGAAVEAASVLALGVSEFGLISAVMLAVAGVAAYDDRPVKPTVVPDIAPPGFWRHL